MEKLSAVPRRLHVSGLGNQYDCHIDIRRMVCIVGGFPTKHHALQFEFALQKPGEVRKTSEVYKGILGKVSLLLVVIMAR